MNWDTDWDGRPIYYDRQGQPMTLHQWAEKFHDEHYTHLARDVIGPDEPLDPAPLITVSTYWLGVNPNWRNEEPLIYETLIIGGQYDATAMHYATETQAREGHQRVFICSTATARNGPELSGLRFRGMLAPSSCRRLSRASRTWVYDVSTHIQPRQDLAELIGCVE
jgi:hypothetical protein